MSLCVAQGNIPCRGEVCSREFDWNSMCEAMPFWKGQEMKRSYYSCITCKWRKGSRFVALSVSLTRKVSLLQTYVQPCRICSCFSCASCATLAPAPPLALVLVVVGRLNLCVQVDYMIGELVTELKQVQLYEDTTVIFWTCALALALPWLRCAAAYLTWRLMRFQRPWVQAG